jgi:UDP-galactopyranose mutase
VKHVKQNKISTDDIAQFRFVVIGSGFSGAVFAEHIASVLKEKVLILEKRNHIGGNAYDFKENGITVQKYGPHIFHTKYKDVWKYMLQFTEFRPYKHRVLAYIKGRFVPLPFNFAGIDVFFKKTEASRIKEALIREFGENSRVSVLKLLNSSNTLTHKLGEFVYENVFLHYTMKQWGVTPEQVDKSVISRVPVNISYLDTYFSDPFQGIPSGGYTNFFEKMLENTHISVMLNTDFEDIFKVDIKNGKIVFKENGKAFNGFVVYTGQIDKLFQYRFGKLNYRSLQFKFEIHNMEFYQKEAGVNYPNDFDFTRITEFKHFYNEKNKKTIIAKEYPCALENGKEPYYPFLDEKNIPMYKKYAALARSFPKLIPLGRLANFKYINMDEAIKNALTLFEKHFS